VEAVRRQNVLRQTLRKGYGLVLMVPVQGFYNGVNVHEHPQSELENSSPESSNWVDQIQTWATELGFSQIGISGVDLTDAEPALLDWLAQGFQGSMNYMAQHGLKRARPAELVPGTLSVITLRMNYLPPSNTASAEDWVQKELHALERPEHAVVSVYARGRDYHKVLRQRLQQLALRMQTQLPTLQYRVFTDSAPVLEVELAQRSGLGWRGKHTLLLNREAGSMFFLGEIFVNLALPETQPVSNHCGSCSACIDICPTQAILGPNILDARRCISYLTIEHAGSVPEELRPLMGNRIYGCDDCQLVCPWNKFAQRAVLPDFEEREGLGHSTLVELMAWTEEAFLKRTEGSAIRRIGHAQWLRNIAIAMGNALRVGHDAGIQDALQLRAQHPSEVVREHVQWALAQIQD